MASSPRVVTASPARSLDELPLALNISGTARALGLHRSTVVRMIRDGRLHTSGRAGSRSQVLISKRSIEAFLQGGSS